MTFSPRVIANTFKEHFVNISDNFVKKLPDPAGKFRIPLLCQYYKGFNFRGKTLKLKKVNSVSILIILKEFKTNKDNFLSKKSFCTSFNQVSGKFTQQTLFVIPPWQIHKRFRFRSPDWNGSFWITKDIFNNLPSNFNIKIRVLGFTDETIRW